MEYVTSGPYRWQPPPAELNCAFLLDCPNFCPSVTFGVSLQSRPFCTCLLLLLALFCMPASWPVLRVQPCSLLWSWELPAGCVQPAAGTVPAALRSLQGRLLAKPGARTSWFSSFLKVCKMCAAWDSERDRIWTWFHGAEGMLVKPG